MNSGWHTSTISLRSLQSNSFRQKSLKQPRFSWSSYDPPLCLLSPQQPPTTTAAKNNTGAPLEARASPQRSSVTREGSKNTQKRKHIILWMEEDGEEEEEGRSIQTLSFKIWFWQPHRTRPKLRRGNLLAEAPWRVSVARHWKDHVCVC